MPHPPRGRTAAGPRGAPRVVCIQIMQTAVPEITTSIPGTQPARLSLGLTLVVQTSPGQHQAASRGCASRTAFHKTHPSPARRRFGKPAVRKAPARLRTTWCTSPRGTRGSRKSCRKRFPKTEAWLSTTTRFWRKRGTRRSGRLSSLSMRLTGSPETPWKEASLEVPLLKSYLKSDSSDSSCNASSSTSSVTFRARTSTRVN
mmetsp:Transcript_2035/g.7858  ORF Transcript_2035/g.7858 Transcript_2035/m.7858 type:complete len:202 (+) Transcript_2035:306-911(+)